MLSDLASSSELNSRTLAREQASHEARSLRGFCSAGLLVIMMFWGRVDMLAMGDGD